jgi:hypothetical protein
MILMSAIDPTFVLSNRIEAGLWIVIAVAMAVAAWRRRHVRRDCVVAAVAFALFGISDVVETHTGAWWSPWWLLAWKAVCVLALLVLLKRYLNRRTPASESPTPSR